MCVCVCVCVCVCMCVCMCVWVWVWVWVGVCVGGCACIPVFHAWFVESSMDSAFIHQSLVVFAPMVGGADSTVVGILQRSPASGERVGESV